MAPNKSRLSARRSRRKDRTPQQECVFCARLAVEETIARNGLAVAIRDRYPASRGHVLIVPRRHEPDFLELSAKERSAVLSLLPAVVDWIGRKFHPDGYNVGLNIGEAAGQTVPHAHLHVIPRYKGDVAEPRGGLRWILPERAAYWRR